jgi:hypothetical protein
MNIKPTDVCKHCKAFYSAEDSTANATFLYCSRKCEIAYHREY